MTQSRPELIEIDDDVLTRLVRAATEGAAPDEVTPTLTPGTRWTPSESRGCVTSIATVVLGSTGAAAEIAWAVVLEESVVGSVRLRRTEEPNTLEVGIWLT